MSGAATRSRTASAASRKYAHAFRRSEVIIGNCHPGNCHPRTEGSVRRIGLMPPCGRDSVKGRAEPIGAARPGVWGCPPVPPFGWAGGKHCAASTEKRNTTFRGTRGARPMVRKERLLKDRPHHLSPNPFVLSLSKDAHSGRSLPAPYSKIDDTTSSMLRCTSRSSVSAQTTATWHARRAVMPSCISRPA